MLKLRKIISGGQTGVDRGALDAAIMLEIEHGGTCPSGRLAEDGRVPEHYLMEEHPSPTYPPRTTKNVLDADATLLLIPGQRVTPGTKLTAKIAQKNNRPWLAVDITKESHLEKAASWLREINPSVLNVAGPRESSFPGIQRMTVHFLGTVLKKLREI